MIFFLTAIAFPKVRGARPLQLHYLDLMIGALSALAAAVYFRDEALYGFAWLAVRFGGL